MAMSRAFAVDSAVSLSLALALAIVFVVDRVRGPAIRDPGLAGGRSAAAPLRLAVTPRQYDDMGKLLTQLGTGYHYNDISLDDLQDVSNLNPYDVIFLTCGTVPEHWTLGGDLGGGDRPNTRRVRLNPKILERVHDALRAFVGRGGTLYVSDWRLDLIHSSFPEFFDGEDIVPGLAQTLSAEVVDPGLRDLLGPSVALRFDLNGWRPARFADERATTYLRGTYRALGGSELSAPLLVKIPFEQGTILFTSFHNEKVNSEVETKLLRFLVFAAVTAREAAEAEKTMISGGFSPQSRNLLGASSDEASVTQKYANDRRRRLRFALIFRNEGAVLPLAVRGPDGRAREQEGRSTFTIDVPDADPGEWTYSVTAKKVPYTNFPYTLTLGVD